jgi:integrase
MSSCSRPRLGHPYTRRTCSGDPSSTLLKRAKLPRIRFHDLQHTAASLLLLAGEHPKVVQERLGHSSIKVTMDTYSHVLPSMQRAAADRLDVLLVASRT